MEKIIIICPGNVITGGVNSLHNLCASLNRNGFDAVMYYIDSEPDILNNPQIVSYGVTGYTGDLDQKDQFIVVPETMTEKLIPFTRATRIIYWLGIKFYFKSPPWRSPFHFKPFRKLINCRSYFGYSSGILESGKRRLNEYAKGKLNIWTDDFIHVSNSHYVAKYCQKEGAKNTFVLHNPIRHEFYTKQGGDSFREKVILFGPKTPKLLVFYARIMLKSYKVIQLRHIPFPKVFQLMSKSLVFAEFGSNHGRDRMPREAAMLGCIVFMGIRGSSPLKEDYMVDNQYKIKDMLFNYPLIVKKIRKAAENYEIQIQDFEQFRNQLEKERVNFDFEVKNVFGKIINNNL